jgi:hypothetical protein
MWTPLDLRAYLVSGVSPRANGARMARRSLVGGGSIPVAKGSATSPTTSGAEGRARFAVDFRDAVRTGWVRQNGEWMADEPETDGLSAADLAERGEATEDELERMVVLGILCLDVATDRSSQRRAEGPLGQSVRANGPPHGGNRPGHRAGQCLLRFPGASGLPGRSLRCK